MTKSKIVAIQMDPIEGVDITADPLAMYLADVYTISANLAGIAALSIPCGFDVNALPVGLQLMAPYFAEQRLLAVGHQFQRLTDHHTRRPPLE